MQLCVKAMLGHHARAWGSTSGTQVDEITFKRPVDVGDLLRLRSRVLWSAAKDPSLATVHVQVIASVSQPEAVKSDITNTFAFVFEVETARLAQGLKRILPATAEEAGLMGGYFPGR